MTRKQERNSFVTMIFFYSIASYIQLANQHLDNRNDYINAVFAGCLKNLKFKLDVIYF